MTTTNYQRGAYLERRGQKLLQDWGYFVVRAAGSKGPVDLVALHPLQRPLLIQAKTGGSITHEEWNDLLALARDVVATPLVLKWDASHRSVQWVNIMGFHVAKTHTWPAIEWRPGVAAKKGLAL